MTQWKANTIKPNFVKKTSSMLYHVKRYFKILWTIVRVTSQVLSTIEVLSASTVKWLVVGKGRVLKRV